MTKRPQGSAGPSWWPFALPILLGACQDYSLNPEPPHPGESGETDTSDTSSDDECADDALAAVAVALNDVCHYEVSSFTPIVEWDVPGEVSNSLPVVGDLDGDGIPEIVVNWANFSPGELAAYHGDGSGKMWETIGARTGPAAHPAIAEFGEGGSPRGPAKAYPQWLARSR